MKIVFSPIGTTDPISNEHDGAMLHICRKYKPDIVYMYLSKEMRSYEDSDHRYTKTLELFNEKFNTSIEYRLLDGTEIEEVYKFDSYYKEFEEKFKEIELEFPDSEIILNTSSGTPGMKGALQIIAALDEKNRYKAVQVPSPLKKSNPRRKSLEEYEIETSWNENNDNDENYVDRVEESSHINFLTKFKKEVIKKHINQYDYHAAFELAKDIKSDLSNEALYAIEAAKERLALNYLKYAELMKNSGANPKEFNLDKYGKSVSEDIALYEYILSLEIKLKKGEYADFVRGISPILKDMFKVYVVRELGFNLNEYCVGNKYRKSLSREKIEEVIEYGSPEKRKEAEKILNALDKEFGGEFKTNDLAAANLYAIINGVGKDSSVTRCSATLKNVERKIRNIAAHQVVAIDEKDIKSECQISSKEIVRMMHLMAQKSKIATSDDWKSYDKMNEYIKEMI